MSHSQLTQELMFRIRGSRMLPNFTCHKAVHLKIHWYFTIIWWPESKNHCLFASGHSVLEA